MISSMNHYDYTVELFKDIKVHLARIHLNKTNLQKQPLFSDDGNIIFIMQGEIFSYKHIDIQDIESDSAFLLDLILHEGLSCLKDVNGHFIACIYFKKEEKLILISDRFGTLPLYYSNLPSGFIFASEVKALLCHNIDKTLSNESLSEMLHFGHLFGGKTLFNSVHRISPATYLIYQHGNINLHKYWDYPFNEKAYKEKKINKKEAKFYKEKLGDLMRRAVYRQTYKNRNKILVSLSGGLDSRFITCLMHELDIPLKAFTMGPDNSEDQIYARRVAQKLNIDHYAYNTVPKDIWEYAKKFSFLNDHMSVINGPIQGFKPLYDFRNSSDVTITSQMCDAMFGSTLSRTRIKIIAAKDQHDNESRKIISQIFNIIPESTLQYVCTDAFYEKIRNRYNAVTDQYILDYSHPLHCYFNVLLNEHGRRGTFSGNIMNNFFMDTRMPSFDNEIMDFSYNLPLPLKRYQYTYRASFTDLFPDLAKIKRQWYNLPIDSSILRYRSRIFEIKVIDSIKASRMHSLIRFFPAYNRPSYTNYKKWFNHELHESACAILLDEKTLSRGLFTREGILKLLEENQHPLKNHSRLIWQIINLEYFFRNFID